LGHGLQQMEELGAVNRLLRIIILVFFIDWGGVGESQEENSIPSQKKKISQNTRQNDKLRVV
jgi:hypothetical protein